MGMAKMYCVELKEKRTGEIHIEEFVCKKEREDFLDMVENWIVIRRFEK